MRPANKAAKRYLRIVRQLLPCGKKTRAAILAGITASLNTYLEQSPDATYLELEAKYGPPQQIAATYVENMGTADILREIRIRRRMLEIISFAAAMVLVIWLVFALLAFIDAHGATHGRMEHSYSEIVSSSYETPFMIQEGEKNETDSSSASDSDYGTSASSGQCLRRIRFSRNTGYRSPTVYRRQLSGNYHSIHRNLCIWGQDRNRYMYILQRKQ